MLIPFLGIGAAALATFAGYHTMAPESQLYGRTFTGLPPSSRKLALTYDDGPNDPWTPRLLDVLAEHNVRATFFLLGAYVSLRPEIVLRLAQERHAIGNHSWDHPNLIFSTRRSLFEQLQRTSEVIRQVTGSEPVLFRPPFGGRRPGVMQAASSLGMTPVMWNVSCHDWDATSPASIERLAEKKIRGGNVILLHDGGHKQLGADRNHTVAATANIIRKCKERGYEFVTIPEMLAEQ